jgi:hypothetical protein
MAFYVPVGILCRLGATGSLTDWWTNCRHPAVPGMRSSLHSAGWLKPRMLRQPEKSSTRNDELELIRRACVHLGADLEMTELVLASHAHDRALLDIMLANGDSLRDYVQCNLTVWGGIFNDSLY